MAAAVQPNSLWNLSENILQNLWNKLPPHPALHVWFNHHFYKQYSDSDSNVLQTTRNPGLHVQRQQHKVAELRPLHLLQAVFRG